MRGSAAEPRRSSSDNASQKTAERRPTTQGGALRLRRFAVPWANRVLPFRQGTSGPRHGLRRRRSVGLRLLRHRLLGHRLLQAQRTHVRPDLLDEFETLRLLAGLPDVSPAQWILAIYRPDRILLLVIHDNFQFTVLPIGTLFTHGGEPRVRR